MLFPSCINKNGTAEISAAPEKKAQNTTDACPSSPTLSFYLRDSAANAALHLRYSLLSFSRATSILSPHPVRRAPESFTPSAGFRRFPKNFVCRFLIVVIPYHHPAGLSTPFFANLSVFQRRVFLLHGQKGRPRLAQAVLFHVNKIPGYSPAHPGGCPGRGPASPFSGTPVPCSIAGHP